MSRNFFFSASFIVNGLTTEVHLSKETLTALLWLIPALLFSTTGELFLKRGMNEVGTLDFTSSALIPTLIKVATNWNIWIGFVGFFGGSVFWLSVISRVPLSFAYPFLGLGYVIIAIESWLFLSEGFHPLRFIGTIVVALGVVMVSLGGAEAK
ncbi:MAG: EamA family transporter [Chloroflexi bacterium]|nr:EamA family transporter [Chloroflexota bacterium]